MVVLVLVFKILSRLPVIISLNLIQYTIEKKNVDLWNENVHMVKMVKIQPSTFSLIINNSEIQRDLNARAAFLPEMDFINLL